MSPQVSDRFPDLDSLVAAKLLLPHEAERLQRVDFRTPHEATWTPILWALKLVCKARWEKMSIVILILLKPLDPKERSRWSPQFMQTL